MSHYAAHVLLLDVDGVIVRNKPLLNTVARKCIRFVKHSFPMSLSLTEADIVNSTLYKNHGHTIRGINNLVNTFEQPQSERMKIHKRNHIDFEQIVYDKDTINELQAYVDSTDFIAHTVGLAYLCSYLKSLSVPIPVYLFSNAPTEWCDIVAGKIEGLYNSKYFSDVLSNNHTVCGQNDTYPRMFKPDTELYNGVSMYFKKKYGDQVNIIFVDDSSVNLTPVLFRNNWTPVQYGLQQDNILIPVVNSMRVLERFISETYINQIYDKSRLTLIGGPFSNPSTIHMILRECIPELTDDRVHEIVVQATKKGYAEVMQCSIDNANKYCQMLIDNGLVAVID